MAGSGTGQPWFPRVNCQNVPAAASASSNVSLPVFGLMSYKLKGSLMTPCGSHELEQENALMRAAGNWLQRLNVILPDYKFFSSHHSQRR